MKSKYEEAGVSIDTGIEIVQNIKEKVRETFNKNVLADIGLFGGLFDIGNLNYEHPVLVSSIDGVGTKLHIAAELNRFYGVGRDIVAHCCDDIVVQGARPLFFLDYVAAASLSPDSVKEIVFGIAAECKKNSCALLGGETAEMPGTYRKNQYDIAGCIVGIVDKNKIIDGKSIVPGDVAVALPSSGFHTNGYSLVRKVLLDDAKLDLKKTPEGCDRPLGDILLEPHRSYAPLVLDLMEKINIKGIAHITGGGLIENVPRILPENIDMKIEKSKIKIPPIFSLTGQLGNIPELEMFRVFNMGVGLVIIVNKENSVEIINAAEKENMEAAVIGEAVAGGKKVVF
jgi:phosphoribosylformylglycinamidine cyclo-ligase